MKTLELYFLIMGAFIGGGFASGREVVEYFGKFGIWVIPCAIISSFIFSYVSIKILNISRDHQNNVNFTKNKFFDTVYAICCLLVMGAMLSASTSLGAIITPFYPRLTTIITSILCFIVSVKGIKMIETFSKILMPIVLLFILFLCLKNINFTPIGSAKGFPITCSILYVFMNMLFVGFFELKIGAKYNIKQIKNASILCGVSICLLIILISFSAINFYAFNLPILQLAISNGKNYGYFMSIVLYFSLITTLVSDTFTIKNYFKISKNSNINILLALIIAFVISFIDFAYFVHWFYLILGIIGIIFVSVILHNNKKLNILTIKNNKF